MKLISTISLLFLLSSCFGITKFSRGRTNSPQQSSIEIPFESIDGLIVLPVKIDGIEGRFMLDNGFSLCALDNEFATKTNVKIKKIGTVHDGNNNNVQLYQTKISSIQVGPFELLNSFGNLLETDAFLPCNHIDGILGASFINRFNWKFDFNKKIVCISSKSINSEGVVLPISIASNNITSAKLHADGMKLEFMIDFGYQGHVELKKELYASNFEHFATEERIGIHSLSVSGLGNLDTTFIIRNVNLSTNDADLIPTTELVFKSHLQSDGVLGINYFENYDLTIDNANGQYILSPREYHIDSVKNNFNASFYVVDNVLRIVQLNPNDSEVNKLQVMQEVVKIDDLPIIKFHDVCFLRSYFQEKRRQKQLVKVWVLGNQEAFEVHANEVIYKQ